MYFPQLTMFFSLYKVFIQKVKSDVFLGNSPFRIALFCAVEKDRTVGDPLKNVQNWHQYLTPDEAKAKRRVGPTILFSMQNNTSRSKKILFFFSTPVSVFSSAYVDLPTWIFAWDKHLNCSLLPYYFAKNDRLKIFP